jgi:hypothetical protein
MSATTRTIQQPAGTGSLVATLAGAVAIVATTLAIAWGAGNLGQTTSVPLPPPVLDRIIDHGGRDLGVPAGTTVVIDKIIDHGSSEGSGLSSGAGLNLAPRAQ